MSSPSLVLGPAQLPDTPTGPQLLHHDGDETFLLALYELQWSRTQHQPARRLRTLPTFLWTEKMPAKSKCSRSNPDTASSAHIALAPVKAPEEAAAGTSGQWTQSSMGWPGVRQQLAFPEVPTPARRCCQRQITQE